MRVQAAYLRVSMLPPDASLPPEMLRIGQCTVDVASREVSAPGARRPFRVTPKAMGVLLVLVENLDKVVSRDALLSAVWPDTLPSDDVLTQAITQLRKAFHEVRGDPQYIETIAKGGYRLLASVEYMDGTAPAPTTSVTAPPKPGAVRVGDAVAATVEQDIPADFGRTGQRPARRTAAVLIALLALIAVGVSWLTIRQPTANPASGEDAAAAMFPVRLEPFLITSAPGFELAPTLSPGGGLVAYMAIPEGQKNIAIMLQTTAPVAPHQLTFPEGMAEDASPRWSPDGRDLAFLRVTPGQDCRLLVVRATGRAERTVATCDPDDQPRFDWTPDSSGLILDRGMQPGLQVLDLATGERRLVVYESDPDHLDTFPRYSPDGRWIGFLRNSPAGDFWRVPAGGGEAERLTGISAEILGWDWTPDSQGLVYARRDDGVSRLYRYGIASDTHLGLGLDDVEQPTMARNSAALAYVVRHPRFGIYRFSRGGDAERAGERLFASSGRDRVPSIAPDGQQMVFVSDRAGPLGLWWGDVDKPESLRLLQGILPDSRQPAAWSSDSKRVLLIGSQSPVRESDSTRKPAAAGVYEVAPDSGRVSRLSLPVIDPVQAAFIPGPAGPDQRLLVLADRGDGRRQLSLFADVDHTDKALATLDDVVRVQVDAPRARLVFSRLSDPRLWQASLNLDPASIQPLASGGRGVPWHHAWSVAEDGGTYLVRRTPDCAALLTHDPGGALTAARPGDRASGSHRDAPHCLHASRRAATRAFSFNPRKQQFYVTLAEHDGGDIGFATFDDPETDASSQSPSH